MDKVIEVPSRVRDLAGLYQDLQKADFSVRNVGAAAEKTYVYLDPFEEKDPVSIVLEWAAKPIPTPKEMTARWVRFKDEMDAIRAKKEEEAQRAAAAEAAALAAEAGTLVDEPEEEEQPSLIRRIFRKLW